MAGRRVNGIDATARSSTSSSALLAEADSPPSVQILVPWATGDGFEGTQLTMKHAIGSIFEDRGREVGRRIAQGEDPAEVERDLPPIEHIWTVRSMRI